MFHRMIGANMLHRINSRLALAFPDAANSGLPFGGRSVILIGDYAQLPPVLDVPMYATPPPRARPSVTTGFMLYRTFDRFVRLRAVMRQRGDDQAGFRDLLHRARDGNWTEDDWRELFSK